MRIRCRCQQWMSAQVLWTLLAAPLYAQVGAGALSGTVTDQAGASVPAAVVSASELATGLTRRTVTDAAGRYAIPSLPPGPYRLTVERTGFRLLRRDGVRIATGETVRVDLPLEVGDLGESVTVTADASLLRGEASGLGQVIDHRTIVGLPLNGRSFIALASLAPGVAVPPPPAAPLPRINGGRPRTNEYLFDGISVLQPEPGQVAFFPNIDAIQEFRIETNSPPAEFGRFNGGVVNLTTKSGSNRFSGTVFEFFRHEALNARNFFASADARSTEVSTQPDRRRRWADHPPRSHVLLPRLPGAAPEHRPHGDLDGADRAAAAGRIHRGHRRTRPVRSTTRQRPFLLRWRSETGSVSGQHHPGRAHGSGGTGAPRAVSGADVRWCREQLSPDRERDASTRTSSACASITSSRQPRSGVRPADAIPGGFHPGHALAGRQRRRRRAHSARRTRRRGRSPPAISARSRPRC